MESALPEKRCVEDGKASQQQEELSTPMEENPRGETERPGGPGKENGTEGEREKEGADQEEEEDGEEDGEPCANSTTHSETNTGQMNGDAGTPASDTSPKTPSKSPSTNRTGRRNQEMKDRSSFICPLCDKNCQTQHHLTMHIRQHNTEIGGNDHSCSICGKALSSASSLDRHMLVHSGERPYKCSVCGQTFTTNGNMHRHMKIHDKGPNGVPASRPISPTKRRKAPKRNLSTEDDGEKTSESPNKKVFVVEESGEQNSAKREEDLLHCPICFKTFICKYGLESHMETHPDTALRCNLCCITFRTHRGLLRHNSVIHKQLPTDPSGRPFIQNNPSIPLGFSDLSFIDFSCSKFPQIAQVWCETNLRRCSSKFHRFICEVCNKGFPLQVSLDLHMISHEDNDAEPQKQENDTILDTAKDSGDSKESAPQEARVSLNGKKGFMECLGLQHSSLAKAEKPEEEKQQEILDSIRFIRVEPSATNLPQENNSSLGLCLLDPISLQGLNKGNGLSVLSLQPLQGGLIVRPISQAGVELADIQQILKMTGAMPSQMTLPLLSKGPESPEPKQVIPLKPKPLVAPRSSMGASTPPPVMNAQQASSGCISPSLPPPAAQLLTSKQSSNTPSSSASSSPTNWENTHLVGDGLGPTIMASGDIKQEEVQGKEKDLRTSGGKKIPKTEYPCRFCTQVFSFPGGLQTHMRAHHYGASPYKCTICTYTAPDNATLMRHLRTHSGERPYVCRLCHYPFTVKANCERHLRKKHMKNTRKEIEKNIEYVTSSSNASSLGGGTTQDLVDSATIANTSCRYCGEDLKTYRALQIHLRTLNGCQRKPFECRQCGAAFLAKRNCIHHLLKQHSEVQEREIEDHINTLVPVTSPSSVQTNSPVQSQSGKQTLVAFSEAAVQDQPLDFSSKTLKCKTDVHSDVQLDTSSPSLSNDCSMEPIDLSIRKGPEVKKIKTEQVDTPSFVRQEVKKELPSPSTAKLLGKASGVHAALPASMSSLAANLTSDTTKPLMRLKPLLPKPVASSNSSEMPPLASIAQIISSVSAAPVLLKTGINSEKTDGVMSGETLSDKKCSNGTANPGSSFNCPSLDTSKRRGKKRAFKDEICDSSHAPLGGFDLESSGELPSVEKMLATTDANKFSSYLQLRQMEPEKEKQSASEEEKEGKEDKERIRPRSKGKKNAYSNSVQKMKCPYCPRVFPWTSSLQRHMLTHTGQKPFPCPQCDAFFSTKSNCERHLLRKHGISNRNALQNTGSRPKTKGDDGSQGSTEGGSDAESTVLMDAVNPIKEDTTTTNDMDLIEQDKDRATGSPQLMKDLDTLQPVEDGHMDIDSNENDEDSQSNKSLDMNDASKPLDVPLSETDQEQPKAAEPAVEPEVPPSEEFPHTCNTCKKTFRHAATLSRHQKIHSQDNQNEEGGRKGKNQPAVSSQPLDTGASPIKEGEQETCLVEKEENSSIAESGAEEEEKEGSKDEKNEEEEGCSSELESAGGRPDKRKKICNVCSKRFWSLQDLTRHMRSHTGERPYQCQTCDRTFTLKHSLVRHQRIHQKTPDDQGADEADGASAVDGEDLRCSSGSDSETTPAESQTSKTDDPGVKEDEETSTAEASKELQTKEMDEMDTESPEPKDEADPSLKDKQDAADKPVV